jgi:dolichyl-phosphate-mannose--protein O-mannosyl transferase
MTRRDWRWVAIMVVAYLLLALVQLGNVSAPQTDWLAKRPGQTITLDLGKTAEIGRVNIYGGAGMGAYDLFVSNDAVTWTKWKSVEHDHVFAFNWNVITPDQPISGRYLQLQVTTPGARMIEIGVFDDQQHRLAVHALEREAKAVTDEQSLVPYARTYMNSTYFDEIYHARTAYEFLHRLEPYETTHPPLGKAIQAVGIASFGMTPFGWRIMGTLAGAAMLVVLYAMVKLLTGQSRWAALALGIFALDFMHFTQTRMGTVDSYTVLFVLASFFYMFRYVKRGQAGDVWASGLFFGLAGAVKWNGLYAAPGLLVLFIMAMFIQHRRKFHGKLLVRQVVRGVLAFGVVPAIAYVLAYIPFMRATAVPDTWHTLWQYQKDMYDYHSQLKATHPFSSKWYEWPIIARPLWLYAGGDLPANTVSTLVVLGNPVLWWGGLVAVFGWLLVGWRNPAVRLVLIALLSMYAPWIIAPRDLTFIYHFFPMLPFWIILLVFGLRAITERMPAFGRNLVVLVLGVSVILFILFYPAMSGLTVTRTYAETYWKWFDSWQFF